MTMADTTQYSDRLFRLLPAIHRMRDEDEIAGGALRALLGVIGREVELVERDILQLYDNWFIETCEDWVIPYLGDLVGYESPVPIGAGRGGHFAPRREVANTIALRRRRGTLAILELLSNDGAGWPARAGELYRALVVAEHVNFARPGRGGSALVRDADLLPRIQEAAELILERNPDSIAPLTARWIASGERYGRVG